MSIRGLSEFANAVGRRTGPSQEPSCEVYGHAVHSTRLALDKGLLEPDMHSLTPRRSQRPAPQLLLHGPLLPSHPSPLHVQLRALLPVRPCHPAAASTPPAEGSRRLPSLAEPRPCQQRLLLPSLRASQPGPAQRGSRPRTPRRAGRSRRARGEAGHRGGGACRLGCRASARGAAAATAAGRSTRRWRREELCRWRRSGRTSAERRCEPGCA